MVRPLSLLLVGALVFGATVVPGTVAAPAPPSDGVGDSGAADRRLAQTNGFESSKFDVRVFANGSARWTFNYYTAQLNDTERSNFRAYADRFESTETDLWRGFRRRARALTAAGTNATGRNMTARAFSRSAAYDELDGRGVVRMSFLWTGFAVVSGDRVVVADVFEGVFYLGPQQLLVFERGPDLRFVPDAIEPTPDSYSGPTIATSESITYVGEQQFPDNRPRVVYTTSNVSRETPTGTADDTANASGFPMVPVGVLVLALGLAAALAWRSGAFDRGGAEPSTDDGGGPSVGGTATAESAPASETDPEAAGVADEELLSDEDRVVSLLESRGGRMKQADIVEETGWSKSKVSMLLSDMEDEDRISKLRVGRENIVSLSGHEPDAAGSPFDQE